MSEYFAEPKFEDEEEKLSQIYLVMQEKPI